MLIPDRIQAIEQREIYLSEVSRKIEKSMSPLEVYESVEELRSHITAMAAAHEELGMDSLDAMRVSLEKFGPAGGLGLSIAGVVNELPIGLGVIVKNVAASMLFTLMAGAATAFFLLEIIILVAVRWMGCEPIPEAFAFLGAFLISGIASPFAWAMDRVKCVAFGLLAASATLVYVGIEIVRSNESAASMKQSLAICFLLCGGMFVFGVAVSAHARYFKAMFPSRDPESRQKPRAS